MKSRTLTCIKAMTLFAALAVPARLSAQQIRYTVTDLGTLGGTFSEAVGVSNRGSISGFSTLPGDSVVHGFLWQKGEMTDLGTLGGPNSLVTEEWPPNESGEVAGLSDTPILDPLGENFCSIFLLSGPYICRPFVWRRGALIELPTLGGNNAAAVAINNRGQVVGASETGTATDCVPHYEAVLWGPKLDQIHRLPPLPADTEAVPTGINDSGQVVGTSANCTSGPVEAVLWQEGKPINLGSLGGAVFNIAFGINNRGQVVGQSNLPGDTTHHAFFWEDGVMTDLGTFGGLPVSLATSINNKSQVVGFSQEPDGANTVACLWENGLVIDLNTVIPADSPWFLIEALGINDRGQIAGYAFNSGTREVHGFLATPCEGDNANTGGCQNPAAAGGSTREPRNIVLPENVRRLLQQRRAQRYHIPGLEAPKN